MASSVSSERAFSQCGITISKRRSRLKGDIVEALQCVKCSLRNDLLFREPGPSSLAEVEPDNFETLKRQQRMRTRMKRDGMLFFWRKMMIIWSRTLIWMKFRVI
jgi:hypothetical protein